MASSAEIPTADELVNVNLSCADGWDAQDGSSSSWVCSDGSLCLDGDLGVYCQCYESMFTGEEVGTVLRPGASRVSVWIDNVSLEADRAPASLPPPRTI